MKVIRKEWPPVRVHLKRKRGGGHYVTYQIDCRKKGYPGQRMVSRSSRDDALEYARSLGERWHQKGSEGFIKDPLEHPQIKEWRETAARYNKTLNQLFEAGVNVFESLRKKQESPYMGAL